MIFINKIIFLSLFINIKALIPFQNNIDLTRRSSLQLGTTIFNKDSENIFQLDKDSENDNIVDGGNTDITTNGLIGINGNNIYFYSHVTTDTCFQLVNVLSQLEKELPVFSVNERKHLPVINLHIQSKGGELLPAFYVSDYIKNMKIPVYTFIDSYAASAATIISVSGKKKFMTKHSLILIHQLSTHISGKFNELNTEMMNLNTIMNNAKDIYETNTNINSEQLQQLLNTDLWLNSSVALSLGLVDKVL